VTASGTARGSGATLPWLFALYVVATLVHFAHNAKFLAQYPNLPHSWSRGEVYAAWCGITAFGLGGYGLHVFGYRKLGLTTLGLYAALGFGGLLHYTRAPMTHHSAMMNLTIWVEAVAGTLLLGKVLLLGRAARDSMPLERNS
jgi:hypothetical protein